jgi:hypothetical protein
MYKESRDWAHVALPVPSCSPIRPVPATVRRQASSTSPVHLLRTATNNNNHKNVRVPLLAIMLLAQPAPDRAAVPCQGGGPGGPGPEAAKCRQRGGRGTRPSVAQGREKKRLSLLPTPVLSTRQAAGRCCLAPTSLGTRIADVPLFLTGRPRSMCFSPSLSLSTNSSNRHTSMPGRPRQWLAQAVAAAVAFGAPLCRRCKAHEGTYTYTCMQL